MNPALLGLHPTFWTVSRLFVKDILAMRKHPAIDHVYYFEKEPMRQVEIMGMVVGYDRNGKHEYLLVDDTTGLIQCVDFGDNDKEPARALRDPTYQLGDIVRVAGNINDFRDQRQIKVTFIEKETDPHMELQHWLATLDLQLNVYNRLDMPRIENPDAMLSSLEKAGRGQFWNRDKQFVHTADDQRERVRGVDDVLRMMEDSVFANEQSLGRLVLLYAEESKKAVFGFKEILNEPRISDGARRVLSEQKKDVSDRAVADLMSRVMRTLVGTGRIRQDDVEADTYRVTSERMMRTVIKNVIQSYAEQTPEFKQRGATKEEIATMAKEHARLSMVQTGVIYRHLDGLVEESELLLEGNRYKLL
ncbi:hypothetical protein BJ742DRAFT_178166 [Cladochytrium replicatum]|nr:hypothetical protein BJ742DRAFT_178166 [Cladochytrium replicatum]